MSLASLVTVAQWAGIAMPTLYAGITFQYSLTMSLLHQTTSASPEPNPKLLARQWLALYQQGPRWVPPLIHAGVLANLYLAFTTSTSPSNSSINTPTSHTNPSFPSRRVLYLLAATLTISILPITFLYFEPGINGACKWKVEMLLREEGSGTGMLEARKEKGGRSWVGTSVVRHSAGKRARELAETTEMGELVAMWARVNHVRWVVGAVAGVVSFAGMLKR